MGHGILDRMELASLSCNCFRDGLSGGLEPGVVVADDELHAVHAKIDCERSAGTSASDSPPRTTALCSPEYSACRRGLAASRKDGTGQDCPVVANIFVAGIENEVGDLADRPVPPGAELLFEFGCLATSPGRPLCRGRRVLNHGRALAGPAALYVHLGDGESYLPLAV
jgi:hypothetical protein